MVVEQIKKMERLSLIEIPHVITCSCGEEFTMETFVDVCPNCKMTYGVTPCSQGDKENIKPAGVNY